MLIRRRKKTRRPEVRKPKIRPSEVAEDAGVVADEVTEDRDVENESPPEITPDTFVVEPRTSDDVNREEYDELDAGELEPVMIPDEDDDVDEEPAVRKPGYVDQLQRKERLRDTLLQAAYPVEDAEVEPPPEITTVAATDDSQQTQPVRIVSEAIHPVSELGKLPPDERFITSQVPLTRRKRQTTVNPDFARARAKSRKSFDTDMLELPDAPVYKIPEEERDAIQAMNDVPSRLDIREDDDKGGVASELLDFVKLIILALILGVLLTQFVIQRSVVDGSSMHPTLLHKDQLIIEKVSRYFGPPSRGQIITIHHPDNRDDSNEKKDDLVKRVIGLPGETVEIREEGVFINGALLDEPYIEMGIDTRAGRRGFDEVTLGENEVYVLGDNRPHSSDSRSFGPVLLDEISGSVLVRIWPLDRFGIPR